MTAMFLLVILGTQPTVIDYYPSQDDCLHAASYLPETTDAACIPAPTMPE